MMQQTASISDPGALSGRVAFITGAGRGKCRAIAVAYAHAIVNVAICARSHAGLENTRAEVAASGQRCHATTADMTSPTSAQAIRHSVQEAFGTFHTLANNTCSHFERGSITESDPGRWWKTFEVNIRVSYKMTRFLLEGLAVDGRILNFSFGKGLSADANSASFHESKTALQMLTEGLAIEPRPRKINIKN